MKTLMDQAPSQARKATGRSLDSLVTIPDITLLTIKEIKDLLDVPRATAVLLNDQTLIDDAGIAALSGRMAQTVRKWRAIRAADLKAGLNPNVNPNALISPEPKGPGSDEPLKLGHSLGYKSGRVLHWMIATLRYDAYNRVAVHHNSFGRHLGTGGGS